jgi:hypothetical protein
VAGPHRVHSLSGTVQDPDGKPLPGVKVTVRGHREFGHTTSQAATGMFYLVVNDIGRLTLDFARADLLPAQRSLLRRRLDYNRAGDLVLLPEDPPAGTVDLGLPGPHVVRGPVIRDGQGERRPTLILLPGTRAEMVLPGLRLPCPGSPCA